MEKLYIYYIIRNLNFLDMSLWLHLPRNITHWKKNLKIKENLTDNSIVFNFSCNCFTVFLGFLLQALYFSTIAISYHITYICMHNIFVCIKSSTYFNTYLQQFFPGNKLIITVPKLVLSSFLLENKQTNITHL